MTPEEIRQLQTTVHAINVEKGWCDEPLKNTQGFALEIYTTRVLAKLALVHAELSEAEEEEAAGRFDVYFNGDEPTKPEGWIIEIADALIRTLSICEALDLDIAATICGDARLMSSAVTLHGHVSAATEAARVGNYTDFVGALADLWTECWVEACLRSLDLQSAFELKTAYNRTRPHRHGGKLA